MPLEARKFIFTVSLCAMLAANPVLATAPTNDEELGTTHDVYVESTLNQATNGIAGVSYVNRMVNAAGNAADAAEAHAAAAGAHALSAAQSADEAHKVLEDKVNIDQGASNMAMVTDDKGTVYPGYITNDMIKPHTIGADRLDTVTNAVGATGILVGFSYIKSDATTGIQLDWTETNGPALLTANQSGLILWEHLPAGALLRTDGSGNLTYITEGAGVLQKTINSYGNPVFQFEKLPLDNIEVPDGITGAGLLMVNSGVLSFYEYNPRQHTENTVLTRMPDGTIGWQKVETQNTDGVVGMVPVGSADANTFSQMWIE